MVTNEVCLILFSFFYVVSIHVYTHSKDIYLANKHCEILKLDYVAKVSYIYAVKYLPQNLTFNGNFSFNVINVKSTLKIHFVDNTEHTTFWANETFKFFSRECSVNFSRMNPRAYFPGFFMIFMESKISCGCIS